MVYDKKTWKNGDEITADGLNNIENGISSLNSAKTDKITPAKSGNIPLLDSNGNLVDSATGLPLPISHGGTGATTAEAARVALGAAPNGFGLGDNLCRLDNEDLNNVQSTGWYFAQNTAQNTPVPDAYFIVRVEATDANYGNVVQTAYSQENSPVVWVRFKSYDSDDWGDWSCENPPMREGIEYRTVERYNGNAVYCKYVSCGSVKDGKLVDLGLGTGVTLIRSESRINESVLPFGRDGDIWYAAVSAYDTHIELRCTAAWETANANWYVKSFYVKQY